MKSKRLWMIGIGAASFVLAAAITLFPLVSNYLAEHDKSLVVTEYAATVETLDDGSITDMLAAAREYNASLAPGTISMAEAFSREALQAAAEDYYDLLDINASGIMGYVEIPAIAVYLPIYHGTDAETLERGVGHLLGSSLPVGGEGSHAVLTGHSGLAREKMFSDLDQLSEGDVFYIHVLDDTLAYEVDQIKIVLPENTDYLNIERGQDYCTLVTCTPYAVNTHRLLVRGHRIPYEPDDEAAAPETATEAEPVRSTWTQHYIKNVVFCLAVTVAAVIVLLSLRPRKRGKHEAHR